VISLSWALITARARVTRPVEGDVIAVVSEAGTVRGRVLVIPRSAHSLEQGFQLLITLGPHTLICAASGPM
jgi:hypothetical protein